MTVTQTPWIGDQLNRADLSKRIASVIGTMRTGGAFGVDAPFGHGKTFFVTGLAAELRADGYTVVTFDAWKADLAPQPLFLFVAEIIAQLSEQGLQVENKPLVAQRLGRLASAVARIGAKTLLRAGDDDLDKLIDPILGEVDKLDFTAKGAAAEALALASQVEAAREAFQGAVNELLVHENRKLPLVVIIDELDRARPSFAIEFLEAIKFIFSTPGVVFCLAVDRANLTESVRAAFGAKYDVDQYLMRFFSFWVQLANPNRNVAFLCAELRNLNVVNDGILEDREDFHVGLRTLAEFAVAALNTKSANLRTLQRCAERANICARALGNIRWSGLTGYLCGLSIVDPELLAAYVESPRSVDVDDRARFLGMLRDHIKRAGSEWVQAMIIACAFEHGELDQPFLMLIEQEFSRGVATMTAQVSSEFSSRWNIFGRSPANLIYQNVGWALG